MRGKFVGLLAGALVAVSAFGAASASAATEFGDSCVGNAPAAEYTLTTLSAPGGQTLTAPIGGVITKVKVNIVSELPFSVPTTVKTLRSAGGNNFTVVNQTAVTANPGVTVADARMPVEAGDRLALRGQPFTFEGSPVPGLSFYCAGPGIEGTLGATTQDAQPGSTVEFPPATTARVPLAATIEPDADNDGYGDETQDKCPQSAVAQVACPLVALSTSATAKRGFATVLITGNAQAPVSVAGTVKLGKGKTAKLSGGTQIVVPGTISKFTLLFPENLKAKLKTLSRKQSLTLNVSASAPNVVGAVSTSSLKVKLKGQKPKPRHRHKGGNGKQKG